jgi:protein-tyrosine phosphatase
MAPWNLDQVAGGRVGGIVSLAGNVDSAAIRARGMSHLQVDSQLSFEPEAQRAWLESVVPSVTTLVARCRERELAVIVHCHQGLDRTGVVLACALTALDGTSGNDAIVRVRAANPAALQGTMHCEAVLRFAERHLSFGGGEGSSVE